MRTIMTSRESRRSPSGSHDFSDEFVARLCWVAFLLTENWHLSLELVCSVFDRDDMHESFPRQRMILKSRLVATPAIAIIKAQLAESARRTERALATDWKRDIGPLAADWSRRSALTKAALQQALLAIDLFPRCALLLVVFEGLSIEDAALLLEENEGLVRGTLGLALLQLTQNLNGGRAGAVYCQARATDFAGRGDDEHASNSS